MQRHNTSRIHKVNLDGEFTQIPNSLLQGTELTTEEIYLICNLYSRPVDWIFLKTEYWRLTTLSRNKFNTAWKGLADKGYIQTIKRFDKKDSNIITGYDYNIAIKPIFGLTEARSTRDPVIPKPGQYTKTEPTNTEPTKKDQKNSTHYSSSTEEIEMLKSLPENVKMRKLKENPQLFDELFKL